MTRCWLSVAFRRSTTARPAPIEPVSQGLSQIVIPLCHSPYRTSDSVLVAPNSDRQRGNMCKIFHRQWICWYGALWRTSIITDSPLSFYPKIHCNYRLPLGRAQGGAFSRRYRNALQPACRTVGQRGPHIYKRDHRVDSTFSQRIYWSKYRTENARHFLDGGDGRPRSVVWPLYAQVEALSEPRAKEAGSNAPEPDSLSNR